MVAVGQNEHSQCDVIGWKNIQLPSVQKRGMNTGQYNFSGWTDIVAVSAGTFHTVGLKSDGTVRAVGYNDDGQCDVGSWENIKLSLM